MGCKYLSKSPCGKFWDCSHPDITFDCIGQEKCELKEDN